MTIGIYLENYRAGGLDRVVIDTVNHWPNSSDNFIIFCNDLHAGLVNLKKDIQRPVTYVTYSSPSYMRRYLKPKRVWLIRQLDRIFYATLGCYITMLWEIPKLASLFKKWKIEALMIHNGGWPAARSSRSAMFAGHLAKAKKILIVIHGLAQKHPFLIRLQEFCLETLLRFLNFTFIAVSIAVKKSLLKFTKLPPAVVVWNGTREPDQKSENTELLKEIRKELGIDSNHFVLGMFGTLEINRGHDFMLKVMKRVVQLHPDTLLLIAGTGTLSEQARIRNLVTQEKLNGEVRLLGFWNDAHQVIRNLDVLVNPVQDTESFGLVALEAMSLKRPVVATRVGGIPEVVQDKVTGFVVDPKDINGFAEKIVELAKNPDLRRYMGEAGYLRFKKNFLASRMVDDYKRLLS